MDDPVLKPWSLREKIALMGEILNDYVHSWKNLRKADVEAMIHSARDVSPTKRQEAGPAPAEARRVGRVVGMVLGVLPTDSRCLIRSLVVTRVLARRGIPSRLVIGVRSRSGFEAHAWVEHDGAPILPPGEFTRLTEL
jgi:hypothetical protein